MMRSKLIAALCLIVSLSLLCSISAYAVSGSEAETVLTYTKQEAPAPTPDTSGDSEPSRPIYEIAIPAEMNLNAGDTMPIYLTENNLASNQKLTVCIDGNRNLSDDGYIYLHGEEGSTPAKVSVGFYNNGGNAEYVNIPTCLYGVAVFDSTDVHPIYAGTLFFRVVNADELDGGTYTGRVCFTFELTTE